MENNKIELTGKVNYINQKYLDSGSYLAKILLGIYLGKDKEGKAKYESVNVTFFGEPAEQFGGQVTKGDYINVKGRINPNKYTNKDGKEVKDLQLIGSEFVKVEYDAGTKEFVAAPW